MRGSYDPGGPSCGSQLAIYQTLGSEVPPCVARVRTRMRHAYVLCTGALHVFMSYLFFGICCCSYFTYFWCFALLLFLCCCWSFEDAPLISYYPTDHILVVRTGLAAAYISRYGSRPIGKCTEHTPHTRTDDVVNLHSKPVQQTPSQYLLMGFFLPAQNMLWSS